MTQAVDVQWVLQGTAEPRDSAESQVFTNPRRSAENRIFATVLHSDESQIFTNPPSF